MASVVAAHPVLDAILTAVTAAFAGRTFMSGTMGVATISVHEGQAAQLAPKPYVIVGGNTSENPLHTLGPATGAKFGATVTVPIRLVTQYPTTERQTYAMFEALKSALDGQKIAIAGFGRVLVECGFGQLLTDTVNGVATRELVAPFDVTVHQ